MRARREIRRTEYRRLYQLRRGVQIELRHQGAVDVDIGDAGPRRADADPTHPRAGEGERRSRPRRPVERRRPLAPSAASAAEEPVRGLAGTECTRRIADREIGLLEARR